MAAGLKQSFGTGNLTEQMAGGRYLRTSGEKNRNFPVSKCRVIKQNHGIVYIA